MRTPKILAQFGLCSLPTLLLCACGGLPTQVEERGTPPREVQRQTLPAPKAPPRKMLPAPRGGGYYKDDGPGNEIPDNLDDIPDAQPRAELLHRFANRPYSVLGKAYVPDTSLKPFRQQGIASWYGKKFHGQKTSIGEPYDMFSMTAAHPTLAIPSYVRVRNVENGKSVVVRVTDRGPFHAERIIDLSYAAAHRLGYINAGSTRVEIETILPGDFTDVSHAQTHLASGNSERDEIERLIGPSSRPAASPPENRGSTPAASGNLFLQIGAFSSVENAESLRSRLTRELDWLGESIQINAQGTLHRLHLGPYASRSEADKVAEKIRLQLGYKPVFVTR